MFITDEATKLRVLLSKFCETRWAGNYITNEPDTVLSLSDVILFKVLIPNWNLESIIKRGTVESQSKTILTED